MRLRQLGTTQSVVFYAPPEVHQSILDCRQKRAGERIDSHDVICWLLDQTCRGIEQLQPLYYAQGTDFCKRAQAARDKTEYLTAPDHRASYVKALAQPEARNLRELYSPKPLNKTWKQAGSYSTPEIAAFMDRLWQLRENFEDSGHAVHASAVQEVEVEQEREVAIEAETVRENQKPPERSPEIHLRVHQDIINFVEAGVLPAGSIAYEQVFVAMRRTKLGTVNGINDVATKSNLYVTTDFFRTVKLPVGQKDDRFLKPVEWILWSSVSETALIISTHEAEELLPRLRDATKPCTHLIVYAAPVTRKMLHFNDLDYYAVPAMDKDWRAPRWLVLELGIFAGRLYFRYEEYPDLCEYLGVRLSREMPNGAHGEINREVGDQAKLKTATPRSTFTAKPLNFMQEWLTMRRKGQDFTHTPMGYLCQGKELTPNHPFFRHTGYSGTAAGAANGVSAVNGGTGPNAVVCSAVDHEDEVEDGIPSDEDLMEDGFDEHVSGDVDGDLEDDADAGGDGEVDGADELLGYDAGM